MGERLDPQKIRRVAIVVKPGLSEGYFERLVAALEKRWVEIAEVLRLQVLADAADATSCRARSGAAR